MGAEKQIVWMCPICKKNKQDVQKMRTGVDFIDACPDCRAEMRDTLRLLKCTNEWMLENFDTHQRSSRPFVLTPLS